MATAEQLITENLDIWTSAVQIKSAAGRGTANKLELYGIKKLRELILELAVRGLLVPQDPNDEPASELLKKINAEKDKLIEEGKAKKQRKQLSKVVEEPPYIVPNGWEWVPLEHLFDIQDHVRIPLNKAERASRDGEYAYYGANGQVGTIDDFLFEGVRILVAEDGGFFKDPIRGVAYIAEGKFWVNNHAHVLECLGGTLPGFWVSYFNQLNWEPLVRGMTRDKLNQSAMRAIALPVPPLAEQTRIVAKVDELMALCDQLEYQQEDSITAHQILVQTLLDALTTASERDGFTAAWARIADHFDTLFTTEWSIDYLKQTILQLAVMGKLVPQDPNDEPASVLVEKIGLEKIKLMKEGKVKKQKKLRSSNDDEKPFELPAGWAWIALSQLGVFSGGKTPSKAKPEYWDGNIPWVTPKDMKVDQIYDSEDYVTEIAIDRGLALNDVDSLLFVARSGILRRKFPVSITKIVCTVNQDLKVLSLYEPTIVNYILIMMKGFEKYILEKLTKTGTTVESLRFDEFASHHFLFPPFEEQQRIVAKVDELMALCDKLKENIKESHKVQLHLSDAIVKQAVA